MLLAMRRGTANASQELMVRVMATATVTERAERAKAKEMVMANATTKRAMAQMGMLPLAKLCRRVVAVDTNPRRRSQR